MYDIQVYTSLVFSVAVESAVSFEPRCWSVVCPWTGPHVMLSNQQHHRHRWRAVSGQAIPWPLKGCSYIETYQNQIQKILHQNQTTDTTARPIGKNQVSMKQSEIQARWRWQRTHCDTLYVNKLYRWYRKPLNWPQASRAIGHLRDFDWRRTRGANGPPRSLAEKRRGKLLRKETWTYLIRTCWACWVFSQVGSHRPDRIKVGFLQVRLSSSIVSLNTAPAESHAAASSNSSFSTPWCTVALGQTPLSLQKSLPLSFPMSGAAGEFLGHFHFGHGHTCILACNTLSHQHKQHFRWKRIVTQTARPFLRALTRKFDANNYII